MSKASELVLRRFPYLKAKLPVVCLCGANLEIKGEYLDHRFNGVETHPCAKCGAPGAVLTTHICKKDMAKSAERLLGLLRGTDDE